MAAEEGHHQDKNEPEIGSENGNGQMKNSSNQIERFPFVAFGRALRPRTFRHSKLKQQEPTREKGRQRDGALGDDFILDPADRIRTPRSLPLLSLMGASGADF